ncbi:hypothetical protein OJE16_11605 [Pantoea tagorei]
MNTSRPKMRCSFAIFMRYEQANAKTEYLPHAHEWGQLIFVTRHVLEMSVEGERLLTPASIPIWIPPRQRHASYNHQQAQFRTFNLAAALCGGLPQQACLLNVDAIVHAIMDEFARLGLEQPERAEQWRLCEVLRDRLRLAPVQESYLPGSQDKFLAPVLHALEANPGDNTTLAEWAARVFYNGAHAGAALPSGAAYVLWRVAAAAAFSARRRAAGAGQKRAGDCARSRLQLGVGADRDVPAAGGHHAGSLPRAPGLTGAFVPQ